MKRTLTTGLILFLAFLLAACGASNGQTVTNVTRAQTSNTWTTVDTVTSAAVASAAEALEENSGIHADAEDTIWDEASVIPISLNGSSISADYAGGTINGSLATITTAGTYCLSGLLTDGQIIVDSTVAQSRSMQWMTACAAKTIWRSKRGRSASPLRGMA